MASHQSLSAKILKAMSLFSGVQAVSIICAVVRAKFIALWIGPIGVGYFAVFNSVLDLMSNGTQLNIRQSAVREISAVPASDVPRWAGIVRWWCRRLGILGGVLIIAISPLLSLISFGNTNHWWAFACLSVCLFALAQTNGEQALMQSTGQLHRLAKATIYGVSYGTILSIPLYYFFGIASIIPSLIAFAIMGMISVLLLRTTPSAKSTRSEYIHDGKRMLKLGFYLTISSVVTTAASYAFLSYLNQTGTASLTGYYQAGYTLVVQYTGIIFTALSMEYFPRISCLAHRKSLASTVVSHELLLIIYVMTPLLVLFVIADELAVRILYTSQFLIALPFITIGIGATVFRAISYCMAFVIIGRGDGRKYVATEVSSALIGLTLNILMFRYFGFMGLGFSYVLWYAIYTLIIGYVYRSYGMRLSSNAIFVSLLSFCIVAASIVLKLIAWWAVLPMLIPALALSWIGYRRLRK